MRSSILCLVIALPCEAKPLIQFFGLKKVLSSTRFPIFADEDKGMYLIISGVGKIKMASAVTYLATWLGEDKVLGFLNVGIAGSKEFQIGKAVCTNKITEQSTKRNWYPIAPSLKTVSQTCLTTHDSIQTHYPEKGMIDMEASAFFQVASLFVTQEYIQVLKIISDNEVAHQEKINESFVQELVQNNLFVINEVSTYLQDLLNQEALLHSDISSVEKFQQAWHFTHTQQLQLKEYLRRWNIRLKELDPVLFCENEKSATQVIKKLMLKLEENANCIY